VHQLGVSGSSDPEASRRHASIIDSTVALGRLAISFITIHMPLLIPILRFL
jgi:hypothetical protein